MLLVFQLLYWVYIVTITRNWFMGDSFFFLFGLTLGLFSPACRSQINLVNLTCQYHNPWCDLVWVALIDVHRLHVFGFYVEIPLRTPNIKLKVTDNSFTHLEKIKDNNTWAVLPVNSQCEVPVQRICVETRWTPFSNVP